MNAEFEKSISIATFATLVITVIFYEKFISASVGVTVPKMLIPAAVFLIGGVISNFIGSSWATWALMMPIGLTLAVGTGAHIPLVVGAVLAGGSIGDNVSPLGETPILTASITDVPIMEHIRTALPYGLIVGAISLLLFAVVQTVLA